MRKFISLFIVIIMVFSMFACTKSTTEHTIEPTVEPTQEVETIEEPIVEPTEVPVIEAPNIEYTTVEIDLSDVYTSIDNITNPAKINQWVKTQRYNSVSNNYETIYWRITDITIDCQEVIDKYNSEDHIYKITPIEKDGLCYYLATYEVYYPVEYTVRELGITNKTLNISVKNPNSGGFEYDGIVYVGLGSCLDLNSNIDETLMPGNIYTGKILYTMLKDEPEYVFSYCYSKDNQDALTYTYISNER